MNAELYQPHYLERWERPNHYVGRLWNGYYIAHNGRYRDADAMHRANFQTTIDSLGFDVDFEVPPESCPVVDDLPTRMIIHEHHWALGWIEWVAIHESDSEALQIADVLAENYKAYPILDDDLFSQIESEDCSQTWRECYTPKERLAYLKEHGDNRVGVFHALRKACRGSWSHASDLLPCPEELLQ